MALPSLLHLAATRPQLLVDHADAWAGLLTAECGPASALWGRRLRLNLVAAASLWLALVLAGVALMLWAVTPPAQWSSAAAGWLLWLIPAVPLALALVCALVAHLQRNRPAAGALARLRRQWQADLALLREAGRA